MNYIYDILINFNEKLFDFYEWNLNDEITHIRKIPLIRVNNKTFNDLKYNKVCLESDLLDRIRDKTEVFTTKNIKSLDYCCLMSNGNEVIGMEFDKEGTLTNKSRLLIDEEYEVIEVCERINESILKYIILENLSIDEFKTRKESEIDEYIRSHIKRLNHDENLEKLKYLYYECFNEKEDNKDKIINEINLELQKNWHRIAEKLYNFFKLTSINK